MADAADARDEDHAHRTQQRHHLRIVSGAARQALPLRRPSGTGVSSEAADLHVVPVYGDDALHYANRRPAFFELAALLDMQLHVAGERSLGALSVGDAAGIAADFADRVGLLHAVP